MGVQGQYERTLSEYAEYLETADSKLREDAIAATCLEHLNQQLTAHKVCARSHSTILLANVWVSVADCGSGVSVNVASKVMGFGFKFRQNLKFSKLGG